MFSFSFLAVHNTLFVSRFADCSLNNSLSFRSTPHRRFPPSLAHHGHERLTVCVPYIYVAPASAGSSSRDEASSSGLAWRMALVVE